MTGRKTVSVLLDATGRATGLAHPAYLLRVLKGPDRRRQLRSERRRLLIGAAGADFTLSDPTVSAVHCELVSDGDGIRVRDLGSKNGVVLRGRRVKDAYLEDRDELTLGSTVLRFYLLDEEAQIALSPKNQFGRLRGSSLAMREVYAALSRAAESESPVLLEGETGTGKDLAAEAIVLAGPRRHRPIVTFDCSHLQPALAEAELFGHEVGAFTGAIGARPGLFERANGGTVYLDRVSELPLDLQPKLLGVLDRRTVTRVGGAEVIPLDVRVIASSTTPLEQLVNAERFRADLFYRLAVIQVTLPPLRSRSEDIPELVAAFLEEESVPQPIPIDVLQKIYDGSYPGNCWELRATVERAIMGMAPLPPPPVSLAHAVDLSKTFHELKRQLVTSFEKEYLVRLLEVSGNNISEASRRSGLSRMHLYELLRQVNLPPR